MRTPSRSGILQRLRDDAGQARALTVVFVGAAAVVAFLIGRASSGSAGPQIDGDPVSLSTDPTVAQLVKTQAILDSIMATVESIPPECPDEEKERLIGMAVDRTGKAAEQTDKLIADSRGLDRDEQAEEIQKATKDVQVELGNVADEVMRSPQCPPTLQKLVVDEVERLAGRLEDANDDLLQQQRKPS